MTYALSPDGALAVRYHATTDKPTVVNLTNHMSFNLAGAGSPQGILGHDLQVNASRYTPLDRRLIPLGTVERVAGTALDLRRPARLGPRIRDPRLAATRGYDSFWVLDKRGDRRRPQVAARAYDPSSGRTLEALTTEPGVVNLHRQRLPVWPQGHRRAVPRLRRLHARNPALPRQPQPAPVPLHRAQAGSGVREHHGLSLRNSRVGASRAVPVTRHEERRRVAQPRRPLTPRWTRTGGHGSLLLVARRDIGAPPGRAARSRAQR